MTDSTSRIPLSFCYRCGERNDAATGSEEGAVPIPGAFSICAYCGAIHVFDDELRLRRATEEDLAELAKDPVAEKTVARAAIYFSKRPFTPHSSRLGRRRG